MPVAGAGAGVERRALIGCHRDRPLPPRGTIPPRPAPRELSEQSPGGARKRLLFVLAAAAAAAAIAGVYAGPAHISPAILIGSDRIGEQQRKSYLPLTRLTAPGAAK